MSKPPDLRILLEGGAPPDDLKPGGTGFERERSPIEVGQRDHVCAVSLPFDLIRLPIPESIPISRSAELDVIDSIAETIGTVNFMCDIQDYHVVEGNRLPGQMVCQLRIFFRCKIVSIHGIGETQIPAGGGIIVPAVVDHT